MSEIHATVVIDTPVEKVLDFIEDPASLARAAPSADRAVEVRWSGQHVGTSFRLVYRAFGMRFNEEFRVTGFEAPRRYTPHRRFQLLQTFRGCVRGTVTWTLEAEGNQTYASVDAAYALTGGFLGRAAEAVLVHRAITKDVNQMLENIKWMIVP